MVGELIYFAKPDGSSHGAAGGGDTVGWVRVIDGLCGQDVNKVWHAGLELPAGNLAGLLVEMRELFAERRIVEPASEDSLQTIGIPGRPGYGGREGNDGEGSQMAESEIGKFDFADISGQIRHLRVTGPLGDRGTGLSGGVGKVLGVIAFSHRTSQMLNKRPLGVRPFLQDL